ncbi:hypothetical protein KC218_21175, partial [Mycobacterium tuberculosis]|nr:hypothetical protein [Mycobacterium tuberculosis]
AYADRAAGFCYFNNAAIVAQHLRKRHDRVAIIDFDTHHGDGTQALFSTRDDVFFGSTPTDPSNYYPHYSGYADETGAGAGQGGRNGTQRGQCGEDQGGVQGMATLRPPYRGDQRWGGDRR